MDDFHDLRIMSNVLSGHFRCEKGEKRGLRFIFKLLGFRVVVENFEEVTSSLVVLLDY